MPKTKETFDGERTGAPTTDYRTAQLENVRLRGETAIDKCVRLAMRLRADRLGNNLSLDLPNPELPEVYDEIDIKTYRLYTRVLEEMAWLEIAAVRTYRKCRKKALARLYTNLELESGVPQSVFRNIRIELTVENAEYLDQIAKCVLRQPVYDPIDPPRKLRYRKVGNLIALPNTRHFKRKRLKQKSRKQLTIRFANPTV